MSTESLIGMHRLYPTQHVDDEVYWGFFPPSDDYYTHLLQDKSFKNFLMSDGTTKRGTGQNCRFLSSCKIVETDEKKRM